MQHVALREGFFIARQCLVEIIEVFGTLGLLTNVLLNLLASSREAIVERRQGETMAPHSVIWIETARDNEGAMAIITVRDCGGGMDEAPSPRLLEPFFTTKIGQGGGSLGLPVCPVGRHQNGRHHGSRNEIEGLAVEIRLPRAKTAPTVN